ncbi:MAG: MmgE/PrpD family protein [Alphaproteobacteria bacterium]|nr:MmgE/PrpD family protein [Alphaproteobacteria bacterium]
MPDPAHAERLATAIEAVSAETLPAGLRALCETLLVDFAGLCVAARRLDYVASVMAALDPGGPCTAIGHDGGFDPAGAAIVNGTAAHGEDFDDTFEGGPVHAGAVILPAVLAAAERHGLSGADALRGIAVGLEVTCRLSLVVPKAVHKAGFHPTAVFGAMGAAAGVGAALRLSPERLASALGIAGSMASGIIEYLAEGTWTKRLHPGWAAQSGYRAAMLAKSGFVGPRTVLEGKHGLFQGFAHGREGDWAALLDGFGKTWVAETIAFKPYACGTMTHPYIDCARQLAATGVDPAAITDLLCDTAEGYVHRLWEPLADKQRVPNGYAGKFSIPYCIAAGLVLGDAGLDAFSDERAKDPRLSAVAAKVRYRIDPDDPYPKRFTGHIRATLADGRVVEARQPHFRGGASEPLTRSEIDAKFLSNARYGGWPDDRSQAFLAFARQAFTAERVNLTPFRG